MENINFGEVINLLKEGKLCSRVNWLDDGIFIMKQIPAEIGLDIIPKMQSVQQTAKDKLISKGVTLKYTNQILIINEEGIANSYSPSADDVFAEDWIQIN